MILILSHDPQVLRIATKALTSSRSAVAECSDPNEAMDFAVSHEPEVIVMEMSLPSMTGSAFSAAYREKFPERDTHFVFLIESGDSRQIAEQLDNPGDDFVFKPFDASNFQARVHLTLRRSRMGTRARFRGDVSTMPFVDVIQFCERTALTGRVCVVAEGGTVQIPFLAGQMKDDDGALSDKLNELIDLQKGPFVIESSPVSFDEISNVRHTSVPPSNPNPGAIPIARTSALRFGQRELTLRTEYKPESGQRVTTTVTLDDKTVREYHQDLEDGATGPKAWHHVNEHHKMVEGRVRSTIDRFFQSEELSDKTGKFRILPSAALNIAKRSGLASLSPPAKGDEDVELGESLRRSIQPGKPEKFDVRVPVPVISIPQLPPLPPPEPPVRKRAGLPNTVEANSRSDKDELFDEAIRMWRNQQLEIALELMQEAEALDSEDRSLQVCLRVLRRKVKGV